MKASPAPFPAKQVAAVRSSHFGTIVCPPSELDPMYSCEHGS